MFEGWHTTHPEDPGFAGYISALAHLCLTCVVVVVTGAGASAGIPDIPTYEGPGNDSRERMKFKGGDFSDVNRVCAPTAQRVLALTAVDGLGFYSSMRALSVLAEIDYKCVSYNIDGLWNVAFQDPLVCDVVELHGTLRACALTTGSVARRNNANYLEALAQQGGSGRVFVEDVEVRPYVALYEGKRGEDPVDNAIRRSEPVREVLSPTSSIFDGEKVALFVGLSCDTESSDTLLSKAYKAASENRNIKTVYFVNLDVPAATPRPVKDEQRKYQRLYFKNRYKGIRGVRVVHFTMSADAFAEQLLAAAQAQVDD
jgi:NAD-dependent SIR2 family protein deacetylase